MMMWRIARKLLFWCLTIFLLFLLASWGMLAYPAPFFPYSVRCGNLSLHSSRPFSLQAGEGVLNAVQNNLAVSPLYTKHDNHAVYVCGSSWQRWFYFLANHKAGGINYYPFTSNVFLSGAIVEENRWVSPSGRIVEGDRTLDYAIAHEIGHSLTLKAAGFFRYHRLPDWIREGYADYLGRKGKVDYQASARAFLAEAPEMNTPSAVPYLRYHFLVKHLIERTQWSFDRLISCHLSRQEAEALVKSEAARLNEWGPKPN